MIGCRFSFAGMLLSALAAASAISCASGQPSILSSVRSSGHPESHDGLYAGFGRADITPPVGVPLAGNGFEGRQADGYRQRLYSRALVLEDSEGERVVFVVADLPHPSLMLHRRVAEEVQTRTGIGTDRLILSVSHTHSGPGNHYAASQYNQQASGLPGFDRPLTRFLVHGIARSVEAAAKSMGPARAGWGSAEIQDVTWNRSIEAHRANPGRAAADPATAVDDTLRMLRVDRCNASWEECLPLGAFSVFAIHGTVMPPATTILDADVHGVVERKLEDAIIASNPRLQPAFRSPAFHLFANGAEGDVSPRYSAASRCGEFRSMDAGRLVGGPRSTEPSERWNWDQSEIARCLEIARDDLANLGDSIATASIRLHGDIGQGGLDRHVPVARAFRTIDLLAAPGLCKPRGGVSTFGGADDARTRLYEWKLLGFIDLGMNDGASSAWRAPRGCQGYKRVALGVIQDLLVGDEGLPRHAQVAVVRVGNAVLAAVPGEVTTVASLGVRRAMLSRAPDGVHLAALIGLSNGYLQYVTTEAEYAEQHYEGGSTLYGPKLASVFTDGIADLTAAIAAGRQVADVPSIAVDPGPATSYVPPTSGAPDPTSVVRDVLGATCVDGALRAVWLGAPAARFDIEAGPVLEIQRDNGGAWTRVQWDDSRDVTVRWVRSRGDPGDEWWVEWKPRAGIIPGRYRLLLLSRLGMAALADPDGVVDCS